jgi:hypothetical protein
VAKRWDVGGAFTLNLALSRPTCRAYRRRCCWGWRSRRCRPS